MTTAARLRELIEHTSTLGATCEVCAEVVDALRAYAEVVDLSTHAVPTVGYAIGGPPEASGIPSDDLRRLWNAEVDDADKLLVELGLGDKATISKQYRSEGGFLRVGKIVSALKERGLPHEPGAVLCVPCLHCSRHTPVDWPACGHCGEVRRPLTKSEGSLET